MKMMLLIAFDFYFYTFLLQSFFEDHQVANFQPLSTESSYAINLNITRLLCRYKVKLSVLKAFSELEKRNDDPRFTVRTKNDELKNDDRFRKMKHDRKNKRKLFVKLCFALKRT